MIDLQIVGPEKLMWDGVSTNLKMRAHNLPVQIAFLGFNNVLSLSV